MTQSETYEIQTEVREFGSSGVEGPEVRPEFRGFGSTVLSPGNEIRPGKGCKSRKLE